MLNITVECLSLVVLLRIFHRHLLYSPNNMCCVFIYSLITVRLFGNFHYE